MQNRNQIRPFVCVPHVSTTNGAVKSHCSGFFIFSYFVVSKSQDSCTITIEILPTKGERGIKTLFRFSSFAFRTWLSVSDWVSAENDEKTRHSTSDVFRLPSWCCSSAACASVFCRSTTVSNVTLFALASRLCGSTRSYIYIYKLFFFSSIHVW